MNGKKIKYVASLIILVTMLVGIIVPSGIAAPSTVLNDISDHWAKDKISQWVNKGIVSGYGDGTFKPDNNITRAEFMALVNRSFGFNKKAATNFTDVQRTDWFYDEVAKAIAAGYISGYPDGTVKPNKEISRQEAAVALCKALNLSVKPQALNFTDRDSIPPWSKDYIGTLAEKAYMTGYPDGSFRPDRFITRAETITMLDKALAGEKGTYYLPGVYGPEEGIETVKQDIVINLPGITLRNMIIEGDLYLNEGIAEGDITLENVTVKGKTIINGGANIDLIDFSCKEVEVNKGARNARITASGDTKIKRLNLNCGVHLKADGIDELRILNDDKVTLEGNFENVNVEGNGNIEVLKNTTINNLRINEESDVELKEGSRVKELTVNAPARISGKGTIDRARINSNGAVLETAPKSYTLASVVTAEIAGKKVRASRSSSKTVRVTGVTLDRETVTLRVYEEVTLKATVMPSNASNKGVTWASDDSSVATVDGNGTVKALAVGNTFITVTTNDGGYTASCAVYAIEDYDEPIAEPIDSVVISGNAVIGEDLKAIVTPEDATVEFLWLRADAEDGEYEVIDEATGISYRLTEDDVGKWIIVKAIGMGNYTGEKISNAVGPVMKIDEVDKSALLAAVEDALKITNDDYTDESWSIFQIALAYAQKVLAKEAPNQEEIVAAYTQLRAAMNALAKKVSVNLADISGVPIPVTGNPSKCCIIDSSQYSGTISWEPDHDVFQAGTIYTATITLTAKSGYTFKGVPEDFFKVSGAIHVTNEANSGVVTAIFPRTDAEPVEGLVLHLDASTLNLEDGASVKTWKDLSDTENVVSQDQESNRPRFVKDGLNGKPVVRFNGENQYFDLSWNMTNDRLTADEITLFMVLKSDSMNESQTVMGNYDEKGAVCVHVSTNEKKLTATVSSRSNRINFSGSTDPYIATYKVTKTKHTAYVDGIQTSEGNLTESIDWGKTTIGRNGGEIGGNISEWYWKGDIAEIRIYDRALTDEQRKAVEKELQRKWFGMSEPKPISAVHFNPTPNLREGSSKVAADAVVGTLTASDGIGDIIYLLAKGEGDTYNDFFKIEGNEVKVKDEALTQGSYSFRVKAVDSKANQVESAFSIVVLEKQEPIEGLVFHLDASALNLQDGEKVASWEDLSGKGNSITQTDANSQPVFSKTALNGRSAVQFDGSRQYLNLDWANGTLTTDSITMFLVLENDNMRGGTQVVMGNYNQKNAISISISQQNNHIVARISDYTNNCSFTDEAGPYVLTFDYDSQEMRTFVDGALTDSHETNESISWGKTAIGRSGTSSSSSSSRYPWEGKISEIRIYDRKLSDDERKAVEEELQEKWFGASNNPGEPGRAYVYYNPYEDVDWETYEQYKANFHTHTNQSDGSFSPQVAIDRYYNAGYKILALTDHDGYGYDPDTTWPWTKWNRDPDDFGMLAIQGNELSNTDHICSLFNDYGGPRSGQEELALQEVNERNGLAFMNHPGRYTRPVDWYANLYKKYYKEPLIGMEVHNQGDRYPNDRQTWDRVNALVMPEVIVFGYSNDDMHNQNNLFKSYQFMLMKELTVEDLREAMLKGAFYFCYEPGGSGSEDPPVPRISSIEVTDNGTDIKITATTANSITWKTDKGIIANGDFIDLDDINIDGAKFVRAELTNEKGTTYTQPFVLMYSLN